MSVRISLYISSGIVPKSSLKRSSLWRAFLEASSESKMRPHVRQVAFKRSKIILVNSMCTIGTASSMWPKCPGQRMAVFPQVLHLCLGSKVPNLPSIKPAVIGCVIRCLQFEFPQLIVYGECLGEIKPNEISSTHFMNQFFLVNMSRPSFNRNFGVMHKLCSSSCNRSLKA